MNVDGSDDESFDPAVCVDSEDEFCDEHCWEDRYAECWDDEDLELDESCFQEVLMNNVLCEIGHGLLKDVQESGSEE